MARPIVWFMAGIVAAVLVVTGVIAGTTYFASGTEAQGTWQVKTWKGFALPDGAGINAEGAAANPEQNFDDWIRTLPSNCDLGPIYAIGSETAATYRCPG